MSNPLVILQNNQSSKPALPRQNRSGVDRLKCFFYVDPDMSLIEHSEWVANSLQKQKNGMFVEFTKYTRIFIHKGATVRVSYNTAYDRCSLDFNPADIRHGKSSKFLHPNDLLETCEEVINLVKQELHPAFDIVNKSTGEIDRDPTWPKQVHIKSIELGCPIEVKNELRSAFERAIEATRPRRKQTRTKHDDCSNGWTQKNSTKHSGEDKIYNKTEELKVRGIYEPIRQGYTKYRFETTLKGKRRDKYGIRTLADVYEGSVWFAVSDRFHECNWDVRLSSNADLNRNLLAMTYSQREKALGYLKVKELGLDSGLSVARLRDRKKLMRELGITPGLGLENLPSKSHYLDLSVGEFVEVIDVGDEAESFQT